MRELEVKKVAWIRVGALGDLLVGLASFAESLEKFPKADAYIIGNLLWTEIIEPGYFLNLHGIFVVDGKSTLGQLFTNQNGKWRPEGKPLGMARFLKGFDVVVNTRIDSLRYVWPALFSGVPQRFGSASWPFSMLYTHSSVWRGKDPLIHERDAALRLLDNDGRSRAKMSLAQEIETSPLIQKWKIHGGLPSTKNFDISGAERITGSTWKKYILVNPTASKIPKAWPKEKFTRFTEEFAKAAKTKGYQVLVIGSPKETEWLKAVANSKVGIVQPQNISELIDVVAGAYMLVANTSSMQFIAASTNTLTITLMGRARAEIWGPLGVNDKFLRGEISRSVMNLSPDDLEVAAFKSISVDKVLELAIQCL